MKKLLWITVFVLSLASCIKVAEKEVLPQTEYLTITATLPDKGGATKAIALDKDGSDKDIVVASWEVNEEMAVLYGGQKSLARVYEVDGVTGEAKICFYVPAGTENNTPCKLVYPAWAAKDDNSGVKDYADLMEFQDGKISDKLDVRVGAGNILVNTLELDVTTQPEPQYAIFDFEFEFCPIVAEISILVNYTDWEKLTTILPLSSSSRHLYVAIPPSASGAKYTIEAYFAKDDKTADKASKILESKRAIEKGVFYQSELDYWGSIVDFSQINLDSYPAIEQNMPVGSIPVSGLTTLSGSLTADTGGRYKISIADGAIVVLNNAHINGARSDYYTNVEAAGLTCEGNATIILYGTNVVKGFEEDYPGIYVTPGHTLTIRGYGSLDVEGSSYGAGIGAGKGIACGNIDIQGGTIVARAGDYSRAAAIGGAENEGNCGTITIRSGTVKSVTATKGEEYQDAPYSIGAGSGSSCGTVTIGGVVGPISTSPYTYPSAAPSPDPYEGTDLSKVENNYRALDGITLTGTMDVANHPVKISIADGATVTLNDVTINGVNDNNYPWAGITCEGDATIILKAGTTNTVKGFHSYYPGIYVPEGHTLTIQGTGALTSESYGAAGIGAGEAMHAGNIDIQGGTVTAKGGGGGAGIGGAHNASVGYITIADGVKVRAIRGSNDAENSIGKGSGASVSGDITIDDEVYMRNRAYVGNGKAILEYDKVVYPNTLMDAYEHLAKVKVEYNYAGDNSCTFINNTGTFVFQGGTGTSGADQNLTKTMWRTDDNLYFAQSGAQTSYPNDFEVEFRPNYTYWSWVATSEYVPIVPTNNPVYKKLWINNFEITEFTQP